MNKNAIALSLGLFAALRRLIPPLTNARACFCRAMMVGRTASGVVSLCSIGISLRATTSCRLKAIGRRLERDRRPVARAAL
jgi:hypothetical protein